MSVAAERHTVHLRAVSRESVRALVVARSATAVKCDGYLNTRARQVLRFVLPRPSWPRRRSAPPARLPHAIAAVLWHLDLKRPPAAPRSRPFCCGLLVDP